MDVVQTHAAIAQLFQSLKESLAVGEMPSEDSVDLFIRLARRTASSISPDLSDEFEDFLHLATQLQQAVKNDNIQDATLIAESLEDAMAYMQRSSEG